MTPMSPNNDHNDQVYWKTNLKYLTILLSIWFIVSFGFGILLVDVLDQFRFFGFKLGFWFAQQGAIYVFIALIFVYVRLMNRLDARFQNNSDDTNTDLDQKGVN